MHLKKSLLKKKKKPINQRKAALRKFNKELTTSNLIEYKLQRAKACKTIKKKKKKNAGKNILAKLIFQQNPK